MALALSPLNIEDFLLLPLLRSSIGWHPKIGICRTEERSTGDGRVLQASFPMPKPEKKAPSNDNILLEG